MYASSASASSTVSLPFLFAFSFQNFGLMPDSRFRSKTWTMMTVSPPSDVARTLAGFAHLLNPMPQLRSSYQSLMILPVS